jgi:hypothetical protein
MVQHYHNLAVSAADLGPQGVEAGRWSGAGKVTFGRAAGERTFPTAGQGGERPLRSLLGKSPTRRIVRWCDMEADAITEQGFGLRRIVDPYLGLGVIISGVTALALFVGFYRNVWGPVEAMPLLWVLVGVLVYIGTRYRVGWRAGAVVQKASGGRDVVIEAAQIDHVALETGLDDVGAAIQMRRPFRRITIYRQGKSGGFIDVSLKHFAADDIRRLMRAIQSARPDLALPKHWK